MKLNGNHAAGSASRASSRAASLAEIYQRLAEALGADSHFPAWLALPGNEWPVWEPARSLASGEDWPVLQRALAALAEVGVSSIKQRREAYAGLQQEGGRPPVMLYETQHMNGRFLGPQTFALQRIYSRSGLEISGAELADHASMELAFLAFLSAQEAASSDPASWRRVARQFIRQHAGKWLPAVGSQLAASGDEGWKAIGLCLVASLKPPRRRQRAASLTALPAIHEAEACTLCGFCVQVCPTHALAMHEDDNATRLMLVSAACIPCTKCVLVCEDNAMTMDADPDKAASLILRESPRAICPTCGKPTVSEAEIEAVVRRLGEHPAWLDDCLDCR